MVEPRTRIKSDVGVAVQPLADNENPHLVAALAATLVEYRRHVKQRSGNSESEVAGQNWRMASRLEQLQG